MAEYIEREKAKQRLVHDYAYAAATILDEIPAADVVEVVHGEWVRPTMINGRTFDIRHCSACGDVPCDIKNYCPNCGADMRGERKCEDG